MLLRLLAGIATVPHLLGQSTFVVLLCGAWMIEHCFFRFDLQFAQPIHTCTCGPSPWYFAFLSHLIFNICLLIYFFRFFPSLYLLPSWALLPGSGVAIDIYIGCGALLLRFNLGYLYGGHSMTLSQNVPVLTGPCMLCDIAPPAASGIIYIYNIYI